MQRVGHNELKHLNFSCISHVAVCSPMGIDVNPGDGVDAIVAQKLEESGQHILRVEVGYKATEGNQKTLRKFYRFNVSDPLTIVERTVRTGDNACFVSLSVENVSLQPMVIQSVDFQARDGLAATQIGGQSTSSAAYQPEVSAAQLFDGCGRLEPKSAFRYLFRVETAPSNDTLKGIACGDQLGKAVISWRKTMGERGECVSGPIQCPTIQPPGLGESKPSKSMMNSPYVVQGSGLSIDVAAVAANRAAGRQQASNLDQLLPITVEPIDPPSSMKLACPEEVQFLVVNHSTKPMKLQLQFRLNHMSGVAVCGKSYRNLGEIAPSGGSTVVGVRLLALVAGLLRVQGCCVSEIETGREIVQPPLFNVFVGPSIAEQ